MSTNIYVGNLPFKATETDLESLFSQFGQVNTVNIIQDRETGRSRGFAFVEMPHSDEATEVIEKVNRPQLGQESDPGSRTAEKSTPGRSFLTDAGRCHAYNHEAAILANSVGPGHRMWCP